MLPIISSSSPSHHDYPDDILNSNSNNYRASSRHSRSLLEDHSSNTATDLDDVSEMTIDTAIRNHTTTTTKRSSTRRRHAPMPHPHPHHLLDLEQQLAALQVETASLRVAHETLLQEHERLQEQCSLQKTMIGELTDKNHQMASLWKQAERKRFLQSIESTTNSTHKSTTMYSVKPGQQHDDDDDLENKSLVSNNTKTNNSNALELVDLDSIQSEKEHQQQHQQQQLHQQHRRSVVQRTSVAFPLDEVTSFAGDLEDDDADQDIDISSRHNDIDDDMSDLVDIDVGTNKMDERRQQLRSMERYPSDDPFATLNDDSSHSGSKADAGQGSKEHADDTANSSWWKWS